MQILLGYSGYALNHLNDMQELGNMVTGLKKFLNTNKNTMNDMEKKWGENIAYLAELIRNIMFDKNESTPKETKMPQMPKIEPDVLLKQKRLDEEKKADEQRQAGDLAQKRATIRRADLFYKDSLMEFGLPENATFEDVKKKYRRLMLEMHPDKVKETPEIKERREQIQEAWDQLQAHFRQGPYEGL